MKHVANIDELIDFVGVGNSNPQATGPVVLEISLWDGRIVRASYCKGSYEDADIETSAAIIRDDNKLRPLVGKLLDELRSFTILSGRGDDTCFLEWTISES